MLPIRKVVLYKHGVGYFERQGEVGGDAAIDLHFRAAEMNDVLKSLTTLDLTGGIVSSISYESTRPLAKQLEDISISLPDQNSLTGLLAQVKGARVAIEVASRKIEGLLTGTETIARREKDAVLTTHLVNLLVDGKSVQSFDLMEIKGISFLDESLQKDLGHLLEVLIGAKKKDLKKLTIFAKGKGKRQILASYVVETPVWKTSYRVLLAPKKASIQGWAVVDNTQDEDWDDVSLTLVAGLPISFVHDLYSPRYKRRPVVEVQEEEAYAPPVLEAGAAPMAEEEMLDASQADQECQAPARSMAAGAPMMKAARMSRGDMAEERAEARQRSAPVQTRTMEVGDLFQYEIRNPVTVKRNQSALVPILHADFDGRRVAIYNPEVREKNPMSAVLFKNDTKLMLEGGPMTVLEDETYVGEAMLDTMKPDEERVVPFSVELGCTVTIDDKSDRTDVFLCRISGGCLYLHRHTINRKIYLIQNKTDRKIDMFLDHRFLQGWDLVETQEPKEKTENFYRFRFDVPPKKGVRFIVSERRDEPDEYALESVNREILSFWWSNKYVDAATKKELEALVELNEKIAKLQEDLGLREQEIAEIVKDQERVRANLKSLGASQDEKALRERYVKEMGGHEDKLRDLRATAKRLREEKAAMEDQLRKRLSKIRFEAKLG